MRKPLIMPKPINLLPHLTANPREILVRSSDKCSSLAIAGRIARGFFACVFAAFSFGPGPDLALAGSPEQDAESALMPFFDVLASPPAGQSHAFRIQGRVESLGPISFLKAQGASTEAAPEADLLKSLPSFEIALQAPDRLRLSVPVGETTIVSCRNQQQIWAAPAAQVRPLLDALKQAGPRPSPKERSVLQPMQIPFSGKHLAMLPVLLDVQSRGQMPLDGVSSRVLDIRIQPDIARMLPADVKAWAMRLWLNAQGRPARIGLQGPDGNAVLRVDHIQFAPQFSDSTWAPPADAVTLTPAEFEDIAHSLSKAVRK
jgi:hypothetical protein